MWRACGRLRLEGVTRRGELGLRAHVVSAALARASARRRLHAPRLRRALPVRVRPAWHLEHVAGTGWAVSASQGRRWFAFVNVRHRPGGWRRARCPGSALDVSDGARLGCFTRRVRRARELRASKVVLDYRRGTAVGRREFLVAAGAHRGRPTRTHTFKQDTHARARVTSAIPSLYVR